MPKGVEKNALAANSGALSQANGAYGTINPIYTNMATNPTGYTPTQSADMLTSSAQSLGGGVAGAVGQGGLYAARTGNAGGATAALDDAARSAGVQQSTNALNVQDQSAALAHQNQIAGLNGLNGIYNDASHTAEGYLGIADQASQQNAANQLGYVNTAANFLQGSKKLQSLGMD